LRPCIILFLVVIFCPVNLFGQINDYGLKLGAQSTISGLSTSSTDGRSFGISAFADLQIKEPFFTTFDLGIVQRGFKNEFQEISVVQPFKENDNAISRTNYLTFTSLMNIGISGMSETPFIGIGPRFDMLLNRSYGKFGFTNSSLTDKTLNDLDRFVFGASIVAGIKNISLNDIQFRLEGKYEVDITSSYRYEPREFRNNAVMIVIGISY